MKSSVILQQMLSLLRNNPTYATTTKALHLSRGPASLARHLGRAFHDKPGDQQRPLVKGATPQLKVPTWDEELKFKGLESDLPCLAKAPSSGPEPAYNEVISGYEVYSLDEPFHFKLNDGVLPRIDIAYETWGELNEYRSNAVLVCHGLSASSHAKSSEANTQPGWWEKFIGPGRALDTDKFFIICPNLIGSCYGSTGPSSISPITNEPYGSTFPILTVDDIINAMFKLLDHLGIGQVHATIGASLGGMSSLLSAAVHPERVNRVIAISSCLYTYPTSIALRYLQRRAIMSDPNWNKGHYYGESYPRMGMKLARELATITYRSGPEWRERFGRKLIDSAEPASLCPHFMIESYLEHQGESFTQKFDPNTLLYISKAMDLFDMSDGFPSLEESAARVKCPVLVLGVQTDLLIPCWQQKEMVDVLRKAGNNKVTFYELDSIFGHDTFLLDLNNVGGAIKGALETHQSEMGTARKPPQQWEEEHH